MQILFSSISNNKVTPPTFFFRPTKHFEHVTTGGLLRRRASLLRTVSECSGFAALVERLVEAAVGGQHEREAVLLLGDIADGGFSKRLVSCLLV